MRWVTLEYRTFHCSPEAAGEAVPGRPASTAVPDDYRRWRQAVQIGFHQNRLSQRSLRLFYEEAAADDWTLQGVYDPQAPDAALDVAYPVATYASFTKDMNVGGPTLLPVHLISEITVRPTHRRRGILREMMTRDLAQAKESGMALAALTATEATIYGRFGFGPTTFINRIQVKTDIRFKLRVQPTGSIHMTSRDQLVEFAPVVFQRCHEQNVGSVGRTRNYAYLAAGHWSFAEETSNDTVRNIVHRDEDGRIDGYASYMVTDDITRARTLTIRDLCSATSNAYLALISHLASIDLVEKIEWGRAPVNDPLEWALVDRRCYRVTERSDLIWCRILDPETVLEARSYPCADADLVLRVTDDMRFAEGTYALTVRDGVGDVAVTEADPDITLAADDLASLFLGGVDARTLAAAERLSGSESGIDRAQQLFTSLGLPYANTYF